MSLFGKRMIDRINYDIYSLVMDKKADAYNDAMANWKTTPENIKSVCKVEIVAPIQNPLNPSDPYDTKDSGYYTDYNPAEVYSGITVNFNADGYIWTLQPCMKYHFTDGLPSPLFSIQYNNIESLLKDGEAALLTDMIFFKLKKETW